MNSDMHTTWCKSASDWIQMHVQGNIVPQLCILCSLLSFYFYELIILLKATSAVFEYLSLRKPAKSSGIKPKEASLSLFPLLSPGRLLL